MIYLIIAVFIPLIIFVIYAYVNTVKSIRGCDKCLYNYNGKCKYWNKPIEDTHGCSEYTEEEE